jgi:hypothetical protein
MIACTISAHTQESDLTEHTLEDKPDIDLCDWKTFHYSPKGFVKVYHSRGGNVMNLLEVRFMQEKILRGQAVRSQI